MGLLATILFPVLRQTTLAHRDNAVNLRKIARAASAYSADADDRIPIVINGRYRSLLNVRDGELTRFGEQRSDQWPLILLPYLKDRQIYTDPLRIDENGIFSGPPLASNDPGYVATGNTFRNQNRFAFYGVNYLFLSPFRIPDEAMASYAPTDFMVGQAHAYFEADKPSKTVMYTVSTRGYIPTSIGNEVGVLDKTRGFSVVNPPGMWHMVASSVPYVMFWTGGVCSGDWCGDADTVTPGEQRTQNFNYMDPKTGGTNTAFLDGHVRFMSDVDLAVGTDYLTATPFDNGTGYFGGGATITDKSQYLWNLNENFYGQ